MGDIPNIYDELKKNDRYFLAILASFILALLLLFYKDLDEWVKRTFVSAYVVYIVGAALLAQIQNMTGIRRRRQCEARGEPFVGTYTFVFWAIIALHILWFGTWVSYLITHLGHPF
jgi:ABC-type arginine/histidine transport system permease subunit